MSLVKVLAMLALLSQGVAGAREHLIYRGKTYPYEVVAPNSHGPMPVLVLLHGAGGVGADMVVEWRGLARAKAILLIAPDWPRVVEFEDVAPDVFAAMVEAEKKHWRLDAKRVYVFGYSAGGYLAFDAGLLRADYFAAIAVFANRIAPDYMSIIDKATRKTPVALYIGDRDQAFSLAQVRPTRDALVSKGFPVHYAELPGRDHNYAAVSAQINADAWAFLNSARLP